MVMIMKLSQAKQISKSRDLGVLLNSSLMQRRILYSCLAIMNPVVPHLAGMNYQKLWDWVLDNGREADRLRTYHLDISDFAYVWGIRGTKDIKGKLIDVIGYDPATKASKIMHLCFKHNIAKTKTRFINVFSSVDIDDSNGALIIRFTHDILPYLINLASYTAIPFKATVGFKCNYSFAMLEYLLQRYTRGSDYPTHTLTLEALHMMLGTDKQKAYVLWGNLKNKVLNLIERDFANIKDGGYDLNFTPVYANSKGRGRRKVEAVNITFSNIGVQRFLASKKAQQTALEQEDIDAQLA